MRSTSKIHLRRIMAGSALLALGMASGCIHFDNVDITSKYVDTDLKEYNCNYSAAPQAPAPQSWGTPGA